MNKRRNHGVWVKALLAMEALKGEGTVLELATEYGVHPTMIPRKKKAFLDGAADIFERDGEETTVVDEDTVLAPCAKIAGLAVANEFLSRKIKPLTGRSSAER